MAIAGVLPSSGERVTLREPAGDDELLVLEASGAAAVTMLELAQRLAVFGDGEIDWAELPATDLSAIALLIRTVWLGDTLRAEALCPATECAEAIDVTFGVAAYLDHHRPRRQRSAREAEPGWFALTGADVRFRIPTVGDLLAALENPARASLPARCVRPPSPPRAVARRVDRALEALAPRLDGELGGTCPECGRTVRLRFEPISYVLAELRGACGGLYAEVHEIALAYHWSEAAILELERRRRHRYAALLREEQVLA